jgi:hypothetical protein
MVDVEDPHWVAVSIINQLHQEGTPDITVRDQEEDFKVRRYLSHECSPHNFGFASLIGLIPECDEEKYHSCT